MQSELALLAEDTNSCFQVTLSGSSSECRRLAFGKIPSEEIATKKMHFPNYDGMDLNHTKYKPFWINAFTLEESFNELVEFFLQPNDYLEDAEKMHLYLASGGMPTLVAEGIQKITDGYDCTIDNFTLSLKDTGQKSHSESWKFLERLHQLVEVSSLHKDSTYSPYSDMVRQIPLEELPANNVLFGLIDSG